MMNIVETFALGMDRQVNEFVPFPEGLPLLNLGAGKKLISGTEPLDADRGWRAPLLPYDDESIGGAYAFHFFEHLCKAEILGMLKELQRCLVPGGSLITVIPLAGSEISFQDLDHKSFWTEQSWKTLFDNPYYDGTMPRDWTFYIQTVLIMGLVQRNTVIVSQIIKR